MQSTNLKLTLLTEIKDDKEYQNFHSQTANSCHSAKALALYTALSYSEKKRKLFFLFPTIYEVEEFVNFLGEFISADEISSYAYDELYFASKVSSSLEMRDERALAIARTFSPLSNIIVAHSSSFSLNILDRERYLRNCFSLTRSDFINPQKICEKLSLSGYQRTDEIVATGQFAFRGCILDIYDPAYSSPVRIEFFGDEVDDIRFFQIADSRSFKKTDSVFIHPYSLFLLDEEEKKQGEIRLKEEIESAALDRIALEECLSRLRDTLNKANRSFFDEIDRRLYPCFVKKESTILDYLSEYELHVYDKNSCLNAYSYAEKKELEYFKKSRANNLSFVDEKVLVSTFPSLKSFIPSELSDEGLIIRNNSFSSSSYQNSSILLSEYKKSGYQVYLFLTQPNYENYANQLSRQGLDYSLYPEVSQLTLMEEKLFKGFEIPSLKLAFLSAKEIYGISNVKSSFLSHYKEAKIIKRYEDLNSGDYVVHEKHGVGIFSGITTLDDGLEYLKIQYADKQVLYVPLGQYKMIRKFSSRDGYKPALDRMGGATWARKKAKIKSKIRYIADQLLLIYSNRLKAPGFSFPDFGELEDDFKNSFMYPYTESQKEAVEEIKTDMEKPHPMDRLIAGDVGFGKTELAFYAIFKCFLADKQAALLCPTTILSKQHYSVAVDRFKAYGLKVELYNRTVSLEKQKKIKADLKEGKIDLLIGTHAILNDSLIFKDLGLFVVDEEQKFGVAHKEKIKERAKGIDYLTLSATPIPRTMQMSLVGMKSISLLSEPPLNRMPVKTYVLKQDDDLIIEVIEKELKRNGQVYYLHNKISDIESVKRRLQKKLDGVKIGIVHAKMPTNEIEDVMSEFITCDIQVLICTSIIESGLDIPNVNTIIVEDSDHFGLAQLYQIKGRVGRSDRLAYSYFFYRDEKLMTDDARKRLQALKDFTELGSGYKIASRDLDIRGAGNILGSEQAGFVDSLGYDAYMSLLEEVLEEKKLQDQVKRENRFELNFTLDAHIPKEYSNEKDRIKMYKELADCDTDKKIKAFAEKIRDIYGPYPREVAALLVKKSVENYLNSTDIDGFKQELGNFTITMSGSYSLTTNYKILESKIKDQIEKIRFRVNSHRYEFIMIINKEYLEDLKEFTDELKEAKELSLLKE